MKSNSCDGMETLWEIACQASNSIVQERAGYLLAVLNYIYIHSYAKKNSSGWEKETKNTVEYIIDILKQTDHEQHETLNHIKVLRQFIDAFETLKFPEHFRIFYKKLYEIEDEGEEEMMEGGYNTFINRKWNRKTTANFLVYNRDTEEFKYVTIEIKASMILLRKKIASAFGLEEREFDINLSKNSKEIIEPHHDWSYIWEIIVLLNPRANSDSYIEIYLSPFTEGEFRSKSITYSISENEDFIETLSAYLKNSDKLTAIETINVISRLPVLPTKLHKVKRYIDTHKIKKYEHWYNVLQVKFDQPEELFMKINLLQEILNPASEF